VSHIAGANSLTAWLQLMRAPAIFTAFSNLVAAHWLATAGTIQPNSLLLLSGAGLSLYVGGMVLNDCFDMKVDGIERPGRPLPSGRVSFTLARTVGWWLVLTGVGLAALHGSVSMLIAALLAMAIVAYNAWLKATWLGPLNMGLCRYLNWVLGLSAVTLSWATLPVALPIFFYTISLTCVSRVEVEASSRTPLAIAVIGLVFSAASIGYLSLTESFPNGIILVLAGAGLVFLLTRIGQAWRAFTPASTQATVAFMIFGIIPLDALILAAAGYGWAALVLLLLLVPGRILGRWIYVT
jgi:heme O synthase-like polyprenyltransferase